MSHRFVRTMVGLMTQAGWPHAPLRAGAMPRLNTKNLLCTNLSRVSVSAVD